MQRPNGWSRIAINTRQSASSKGGDDKMGGFPRPKSLGHARKAIVHCVATKLMRASQDVIDRFFDQVTGRTSFAAFISIRIVASYSPIDWQPSAAELLDSSLRVGR
jgi:hypothetical protein